MLSAPRETGRLLRGAAAAVITAACLTGLAVSPAHAADRTYAGNNGRILFDTPSLAGTAVKSVNPGGGGLQTENDPAMSAAYSPSGTRLAYYSRTDRKIHVRNTNFTGDIALTPAAPGANIYGAITWSPDGSKLAYTNTTNGTQAVVEVVSSTIPTAAPTKLTPPTSLALQPSWSNDSTAVTYSQWFPIAGTGVLQADILVRAADGIAPALRLTNDNLTQMSPTWSPNGDRICYAVVDNSFTPSKTGIAATGMINFFGWSVGGSGLVVPMASRTLNPLYAISWTPDSSKMIGNYTDTDGITVFTVPPFGTGTWPAVKTFVRSDLSSAVLVSPDATKLAYKPLGINEIRVMNASGAPAPITVFNGFASLESWQRI